MKMLWKRCSVLSGALALMVFASGCELLPFTATVEVRNQSVATITEIYIAPSASPNWGSNLLDENLSQFDSEVFTVPAGRYDMRAVDSLGREETRFNVRLRPDDEDVWTISEFKDAEE